MHMKRSHQSILGVTLLEIMLVLAIAAMVIVMSIRYYQSATSSQQANMAIEQIQAIMSAVDGVSQGSGSYSSISNAQISTLLPATGLTTPWGPAITVSGTSTSTYTVSLPSVPQQICPLIEGKLNANQHLSTTDSCGTSPTSVTYTYTTSY